MKNRFNKTFAAVSLLSFAAVAYSDRAFGDSAQAAQSSVAKFKASTTLNDIHHANLFEIKLANLANQKTDNPQINTLSQRMSQDHQKSDAELKSLASRENIDLSNFSASDSEQGVLSSLEQLRSVAFNMAYLDYQKNLHKSLEDKLTLILKDEKDPQIKSLLQGILPTVRHHEQMTASLALRTRAAMAGQMARR